MRDVTYVCVQTETLDFTNIKIIRSRRITSVMNFFTFKSEAAHRSKHTNVYHGNGSGVRMLGMFK